MRVFGEIRRNVGQRNKKLQPLLPIPLSNIPLPFHSHKDFLAQRRGERGVGFIVMTWITFGSPFSDFEYYLAESPGRGEVSSDDSF